MPSSLHWHTIIIVHILGSMGALLLSMIVSRVYAKAHQELESLSYHLLPSSADSSVSCSAICSIFPPHLCIMLHAHDVPLCSLSLLIKVQRPVQTYAIERGICDMCIHPCFSCFIIVVVITVLVAVLSWRWEFTTVWSYHVNPQASNDYHSLRIVCVFSLTPFPPLSLLSLPCRFSHFNIFLFLFWSSFCHFTFPWH